jgi:hypothetical protein
LTRALPGSVFSSQQCFATVSSVASPAVAAVSTRMLSGCPFERPAVESVRAGAQPRDMRDEVLARRRMCACTDDGGYGRSVRVGS